VGNGSVRPAGPRKPWRVEPRLARARPGRQAATEAADGGAASSVARTSRRRLWAEGRRSLLVVLQGIDTSGKDAPSPGCSAASTHWGCGWSRFGSRAGRSWPTTSLWRGPPAQPGRREIADLQSVHYEDVLPSVGPRAACHRRLQAPATRTSTHSSRVMHRPRHDHREGCSCTFEDRAAQAPRPACLADPEKAWKVRPSHDYADRRSALQELTSGVRRDVSRRTSEPEHRPRGDVVPADHKCNPGTGQYRTCSSKPRGDGPPSGPRSSALMRLRPASIAVSAKYQNPVDRAQSRSFVPCDTETLRETENGYIMLI